MNIAELQSVWIEATAYGSVAILLVLALRRFLRQVFGAGAAYLVWGLVPMAMVSALLPAVTVLPAIAVAPDLAGPVAILRNLSAPQSAASAAAWIVPGVWAAGALLTAIVFGRRQRRFLRTLGPLAARDDGMYVAQASAGLPAAIGILRPRIVLPADYETRFDPVQQQLVWDHEQIHISRGDQLSNLLALILRCLLWFNPLVYWAAPRFRQDQELACDARVIARHPQARRAYGEALLRSQLPALTAPLCCQMGFAHPLAERIAMLKQPLPGSTRRMTGLAVVLLVATAAGFAANAAQSGADRPLQIRLIPLPGNVYPPTAQEQRLSGKVLVAVEYDDNGQVVSASVERSDPAGVFEDVAIKVATSVSILPARRNGVTVGGRVKIPVRFDWKPLQQ